MFICTHTRTHTHAHTHTHTLTHAHNHAHSHTHIHIHTHLQGGATASHHCELLRALYKMADQYIVFARDVLLDVPSLSQVRLHVCMCVIVSNAYSLLDVVFDYRWEILWGALDTKQAFHQCVCVCVCVCAVEIQKICKIMRPRAPCLCVCIILHNFSQLQLLVRTSGN
jgi:hypothetical protein